MRVEIHDRSTQALIDVLDRAYKVSYDNQVNAIDIASFSLPRDSEKWSSVAPFQEIWIYDDLDQLVFLGRVAPMQERREDSGTIAMVKCEGYGAVLQDDLVVDENIYTNQTPTQILTALLAFQTVARVSLGTIDASLDKLVTVRASNVNVMRACWELRNVTGGFIDISPTAADPKVRKLNLRADPGQDIGQRIYKGWNLRELSKSTETSPVVTKIWPLGRGEGRPQVRPSTDKLTAQPATLANAGVAGQRATVTITDSYSRYKGWTAAGAALPTGADANDTRSRPLKVYFGATDDTANWEQGASERVLRSKVDNYTPPAGAATLDYVHADYLIADDTIGTYGTIGGSLVDKSHETSDALVRATRVYLDTAKQPRVSHEVRVHDLARIYTSESFERLHLHDKVNVWDPDLGVTTKDRIVAVKYGDMQDPTTYEITVSNLELAALTSRAVQLADRVRKYEGQPDGATTLYGPDSFEDNLTAAFPYTRNIEIPQEALSILGLKLRMRAKAYRFYVSTATVPAGGGGTSSTDSFALGGASPSNSGGDAGHTHDNHTAGSSAHTTDAQGIHTHPGDSLGTTADVSFNLHDHFGTATAESLSSPHAHTPGTTGTSVSHSHNVNTHTHTQTHAGYQHDHTIGHSHNVPGHSHTTPSHVHSVTVNAGINETTTPTSIEVKVDGTVASAAATSLDDFDLTPYLTRSADGSIQKGLHTITFTPDQNGRVQATIKGLLFLQSRGAIVG